MENSKSLWKLLEFDVCCMFMTTKQSVVSSTFGL